MQTRDRAMNSEEIYRHIKDDIINFTLLPGALISENELARKYNVSRTPVKSAFLRLMSEKFIEIEPQRGTYVTKLDLGMIKDIIFMRTTLEREMFQSVAARNDTELLNLLSANLDQQAQLVAEGGFEPKQFYALDSAFHRAVFEREGRLKLWQIIQEFQVYYTRFRMLDIIATSAFDELVKEHRALFQALQTQNANAIANLLQRHLSGNLKRLEPRIPTEFSEYFTTP